MDRPRKDYIVFNSATATLVGNRLRWQVQPHMYRNWQPNDLVSMKLINCGLEAVAVAGASTRNIVIVADIPTMNQDHVGTGDNFVGVLTSSYVATGTLLAARDLQPSPELYCERLNTITIGAYSPTELALTVSTYPSMFMFEITYYSQ